MNPKLFDRRQTIIVESRTYKSRRCFKRQGSVDLIIMHMYVDFFLTYLAALEKLARF
jgi:hypothetical protein